MFTLPFLVVTMNVKVLHSDYDKATMFLNKKKDF